jgi:hypothetical protein
MFYTTQLPRSREGVEKELLDAARMGGMGRIAAVGGGAASQFLPVSVIQRFILLVESCREDYTVNSPMPSEAPKKLPSTASAVCIAFLDCAAAAVRIAPYCVLDPQLNMVHTVITNAVPFLRSYLAEQKSVVRPFFRFFILVGSALQRRGCPAHIRKATIAALELEKDALGFLSLMSRTNLAHWAAEKELPEFPDLQALLREITSVCLVGTRVL